MGEENSYLNESDVLNSLAGRIEVLHMTNFMCHSNLELKFNSSINFITGRNGSGKSAIMAALVVVLGGSASLTGRGSGIADFIKKGETWAKVSITLSNEGSNSFKRELYGTKIIICRNISRTGANSYTCKSDWGSIVSKRKEEVDAIVFALNWQIKNPICILNQDVARSFLCATSTGTRFSMFIKATQLENLKILYTKTMDLLLLTKKQMLAKEKGLEEATQEIAELKEKLALFVTLEKHVHGKRNLENEYLWSLVAEEEKNLRVLDDKSRVVDEKIKKMEAAEANYSKTLNELEAGLRKIREEMDTVREAESDKREMFTLRRELEDLEKQIQKHETLLKQAMTRKAKFESDIKGVKEHLNHCDINSTKNEEERKRLNKLITSLKDDLADLRQKIAAVQGDIDAGQKSKIHHLRNVETLNSDAIELEQNKRMLEAMARNRKSKGENNLLKYGYFTQDLIRAIEEADRGNSFRKRPVGPCGMFVNFTGDPKWARAVESVVGGLMSTYCCDNQKDFQVLTHIMDRVCGEKQPTIIISKFIMKRHDVTATKVSVREHSSILDVLSFSNDVVFNTFIDQARIETIVLFETDKQASSVMTHIQNVPKNLKMGLTAACDQYFPAPNYRTYFGNSKAPLKYFDTVIKDADSVKRLETEIKVSSQVLERKNLEVMRAKEAYAEITASIDRFQSDLKELKQNERRIQVELNQMKDMLDSVPVTITKVALEEELVILEKNHEETCIEVNQCKDTLISLELKKAELSSSVKEAATRDKAAEMSIRQMEEKVEKGREKFNRVMSQRKEIRSKVSEMKESLKELELESSRKRESLEEKLKEARDICPERVDTDKTPAEVQKLLEKCERYLKTAEKVTGSKEDMIQAYKTKLKSFKDMKKAVAVFETIQDTLVKETNNKLGRLKILETHMANMVSFHFQATLQTRGYDGQLKVDFDNLLLDLEVTPKDGSDPRKDSKTLSGGERSYSTVSFILAIWKVVNMPVYFLDEFDVFMDKVNRKVIMDLLLEHAMAQSNKQFVFVTPHDISGIQASNSVSVYRLPNPKRKATD